MGFVLLFNVTTTHLAFRIDNRPNSSTPYTMDPFGTTVTAFDFTNTVIRRIIQYYSDVTGAETEAHQLKEYLALELESLDRMEVLYRRLIEHPPSHSTESLRELEKFFKEGSLPGRPGNLHKELKELITWLDNQTTTRGRNRLDRFLCRITLRERDELGEDEGMSLLQRLKWPILGKKRIQQFIPKFVQRRDHLMFALTITQRQGYSKYLCRRY